MLQACASASTERHGERIDLLFVVLSFLGFDTASQATLLRPSYSIADDGSTCTTNECLPSHSPKFNC